MLANISMKGICDTWGVFLYPIYADHIIGLATQYFYSLRLYHPLGHLYRR